MLVRHVNPAHIHPHASYRIVTTELVMTVPNDASTEILNDFQLYDSVAVVERGRVCVCVRMMIPPE